MARSYRHTTTLASVIVAVMLACTSVGIARPASAAVSPCCWPHRVGHRNMVLRRVRNPLPAPPPPSGVPAENIVDAAAFESSINGYRASNKLSSLVTGGGLDSGSQAWSWDMAHNGFRHSVLPAGEGENIYWSKGMWATCADARANAGAVAQQAFDAFRNSPPHNQNMLGGSWTRQGAGLVCIDGSGGAAIYVTSRFSV